MAAIDRERTTQAHTRRLFKFKPDGTLLRRRTRKAKDGTLATTNQWEEAGYSVDNGRIKVDRQGKAYWAHNIIWELNHGYPPPHDSVLHLNGVLSDNRPSNLSITTDYPTTKSEQTHLHATARVEVMVYDEIKAASKRLGLPVEVVLGGAAKLWLEKNR